MVSKRLAFQGDYRSEFGGIISRPWKAYRVFNHNKEIGSLYVEPEDYPARYHVYIGGFETSGERVGGNFKTEREAIHALQSILDIK